MKMVLSTSLFAFFGFYCLVSCVATNCGNRLPVTDYFQHGYDLSEFDIYGCPEIGGKRAQIAVYDKCDNGRKYKTSYFTETEYDVPDAIASIYYFPSIKSKSGHIYTSFKNFADDHIKDRVTQPIYERDKEQNMSLFTNGQFYKDMQRRFANESYVPCTYEWSTFLHAAIHSEREGQNYSTPEFQSDIEALPLHFNRSEKQYLDFVKKYGTHSITEGHFGGILNRMTVIRKANAEQWSEINWEMRKDFPALNDTIRVLCEKKDGPFRVQVVQSEDRNFTQYMIGGWANYTLFRGEEYGKKLSENPVLVYAEVRSISNLIEDKDKQQSLEEAINVHMAQAYLRSAVRTVQILLDSGRTARNETTALMNKYEQSKSDHNVVELNRLANDFNREAQYLEQK